MSGNSGISQNSNNYKSNITPYASFSKSPADKKISYARLFNNQIIYSVIDDPVKIKGDVDVNRRGRLFNK